MHPITFWLWIRSIYRGVLCGLFAAIFAYLLGFGFWPGLLLCVLAVAAYWVGHDKARS